MSDIAQKIKVLEELRTLHNWHPSDVVTWFMYFTPEKEWVGQSDIERLFEEVGLEKSGVQSALYGLSGNLLRDHRINLRRAQSEAFFRLEKRFRVLCDSRFARHRKDPEPERKEVSQSLQDLVKQVTDQNQRTYLTETLLCLQAGANRAAVVMAWNSAYDHLRAWLFKRHLTAFNQELATRVNRKSGEQLYDQVTTLDDFPQSEFLVIEVAYRADLLHKNKNELLVQCLQERNSAAHPGPNKFNPVTASGYVAKLVQNIITDPAFA